MSAADFLLAPEVQKLLRVVLASPKERFTLQDLAKKTKLEAEVLGNTQAHLVGCGMLVRDMAEDGETETLGANTAFIFYAELRRMALKSFAAAEPIRAMLRSKFKRSVLQAFVLGEHEDATVELLVVHGQNIPDESEMAAACRRLSASIGRHLQVHVISHGRHAALTPRDALGAKLAAPSAFEILRQGDTKAEPPVERRGLFENAKRRLAALGR